MAAKQVVTIKLINQVVRIKQINATKTFARNYLRIWEPLTDGFLLLADTFISGATLASLRLGSEVVQMPYSKGATESPEAYLHSSY